MDQNQTTAEVITKNNVPREVAFLFIFTTIFVAVFVRAILLKLNLYIPLRVVMYCLGGTLGFCSTKYPEIKEYVSTCYMNIDTVLIIFLPVIAFHTSYSVDTHTFWRNLPQVILIAGPGIAVTMFIVSFMAMYVIEPTWDFPTALLFGVVCAPVYPVEVVKQLKEMSKGKYVGVLLLGEGLMGDVTVMIVFVTIFSNMAGVVTSASQVTLLVLRYAGGGILLGFVSGSIISKVISTMFFDSICTFMVTVSGAYLTYYIGEMFFYVSGLLATVIAGVMVSNKKSTVASDVEHLVSNCWQIMADCINTLIFTMVGVVTFDRASQVLSVRHVSLIFVTYTTVYFSRFIIYMTFMFSFPKYGQGKRWQSGMASVWGGVKGPLSLCLALFVFETPGIIEIGQLFLLQATGLVLVSLIINATTMSKMLKALGLTEISLAKKANMTNCVRRIMTTRDRCISMLKMDKFLADANWDLVQFGTTIKHPYQLQLSRRDEDYDDDDNYMGYRYTTCPDCEREIPNEPTKKEFAEMIREANQRVLKAMKISYWRQYEHGKISKDGARMLVQAVDVATDTPDGMVNLEQLGSLWRPKPFAVWLRKKLIKTIVIESTVTQLPKNKIRQQCFRMVTSIWFELFIYLMILANTPVILLEVLSQPPISKHLTNTIKGLNFFFYVVYFWEMIFKIIAFTFIGYIKSKWNQLDFIIIVMATGGLKYIQHVSDGKIILQQEFIDLVLDLLDLFTAWNKNDSANSNFLTAAKLLRMLRFLRLCKLARVFVPKIMAYIDRVIDMELAFGYDVGKGFVTGETEVCNLLPQLVDNHEIQEKLTARLETDRLLVTRQLGLLQRDRPWTAITVKTKQATHSTLNIMLLESIQLKEEGFLDEVEFRLLTQSIRDKIQQSRHKGSLVAPSSPETQLRAVSWLQGNERVADFFLENSEIINYNVGDILISKGEEPKGIFVVVSGLLEAAYEPMDAEVEDAIPNYEFFSDVKFKEPTQDYIVSGNGVGIIGVLTNRPYCYTVRCDSSVQAYHITLPIIKEAFNLSPHPLLGLEASLWREIGIKLAMLVLPSVPAYSSWTVDKLSLRLEHAFVPCLKAFKIFVVNELMEDVVLIDGLCQDASTREIYRPPCYIPRTVHRLVFPKSSRSAVSSSCTETKLLIIPAKNADELDIMEDEIDDTQCELVSNVSSRCLYHKALRKLSNESPTTAAYQIRPRTRGNKARRQRTKRANVTDSYHNKNAQNPSGKHLSQDSSEKEIASKFFKPAFDDLPEKL